jgi:hypothetical protein
MIARDHAVCARCAETDAERRAVVERVIAAELKKTRTKRA